MIDHTMDDLEKRLAQLLDTEVPENAAHDVAQALVLAESLQAKGYSFDLKDLCRKSLTDSNWRAEFELDGKSCSAENEQAAVAVCAAAVAALES